MVAVKKLPPARTDLKVGGQNFHLDYKESKSPGNFAGFIFLCSNETIPDPKSGVFGLPAAQFSSVRAIKQGMPLFLFNYSSRCLCGVFEAASDGGLNLNPFAWENVEVRKLGRPHVSRYPAQVWVNEKFQRPPLDEETFRPELDHVDGHKFRLELTSIQVKRLLKLFSVPEIEFFGDRSKKWLQSTGIGTYVPDSPRSTFKSDSDCYSECSSKGTFNGEDDWIEDDKAEKISIQSHLPYGNSELSISDRLRHLSLNDMASTNCKVIDLNSEDNLQYDATAFSEMPFSLHGSNTAAPHSQQSALKNNVVWFPYAPWAGILESRDPNKVLSRSHDAYPAVNSNPGYASDAVVTQSESEDEAVSLPLHYLHAHMMPVQGQLRWSDQKNLANGALSLKQGHNLENRDKVSNRRSQKPSQQQHPIYLHGPQYANIFLPFPAARAGSIYDSNHIATVSPPCSLPSFGQGVILTHPQFNAMDQVEEGQATMNSPQMLVDGYHHFLYNCPFPLWLLQPAGSRVSPSQAEALHFNILHFTRLTRPSVVRQRFVEAAIDSVRSCVRNVWHDADVEVFGSFATGLCLQHSDVDLAVVNAPLLPSLANTTTSQACPFLLRKLGVSLKESKCCDSYKVIANASVPVLKCYCRPIVKMTDPTFLVPSVAIDITIGGIENSTYKWNDGFNDPNVRRMGSQQHTGGAARQYVLGKIRELPALAPLVLLLKSFLHHKGLSNVYLGGLGSFSLTLLLAFYLERAPSSNEGTADGVPDDVSTGQTGVSRVSSLSDIAEEFEVSLTKIIGDEFLSNYKSAGVNWSLGEYYVRKAASAMEKVVAYWDVGGMASLGKLLLGFLETFGKLDLAREKIVLKGMDGSPGGFFRRDNKHIAVWIDDPLRPGVNVAAGSFGILQVQAAFRELHWALANELPLTSLLRCGEKHCQDLAAIGDLPRLGRLLIEVGDYYEKD